MTDLAYDDASHTYRVNGVVVLSVTQTLEAAGIIPPYTGDPWYGDRGTAVHAATWLDDQGLLDEGTVDPQIAGHLAAWRKFRRESGFVPIGGETPLHHPLHGHYAGTPDRWDDSLLVDIKTGGEYPWHTLQRAAYRELLKQSGVRIKRDICVYLKNDGRYTTSKDSSMPHDLSVFYAAITINRWKERHGNGNRNS